MNFNHLFSQQNVLNSACDPQTDLIPPADYGLGRKTFPNFIYEESEFTGQHRNTGVEETIASDDSVYDHSYQHISNRQHPLLRIHKLSKRIEKDKKINNRERKALKSRRNIIAFRLRQWRQDLEQELQHSCIPEV